MTWSVSWKASAAWETVMATCSLSVPESSMTRRGTRGTRLVGVVLESGRETDGELGQVRFFLAVYLYTGSGDQVSIC